MNEYNNNQRRIYIDTVQIFDSYQKSVKKSLGYKGGMHWKKSKKKQYLFRNLDRYGNGTSLGPRSEQTENILAKFQTNKKEVSHRLSLLKESLSEQARFCKASRIERVPNVVTSILRLLEQSGLLGGKIIVVGTNALYAYESAAGIFFDQSLTATVDIDLMLDAQCKLLLAPLSKDADRGLLDLLKKADSSFEILNKGGFRAANKKGYMVDLLKPIPNPHWKKEELSLGGEEDLLAVEVRNLKWLASSPKFSSVVIGMDGFPAKMIVPDPRSFVIHKLWVSNQDDREAIKKRRDQEQAKAVARLVDKYLPQHPFDTEALRMFPKDILQVLKTLSPHTTKMPPGF